jgi:hypothetical protein
MNGCRICFVALAVFLIPFVVSVDIAYHHRFDSELRELESDLRRQYGTEVWVEHSRFNSLGNKLDPGHPELWEDAIEAIRCRLPWVLAKDCKLGRSFPDSPQLEYTYFCVSAHLTHYGKMTRSKLFLWSPRKGHFVYWLDYQ